MHHIYGVPALDDSDRIYRIAQWSRALARAIAARDAAIVRDTGQIPEGDPETVAGMVARLAALEDLDLGELSQHVEAVTPTRAWHGSVQVEVDGRTGSTAVQFPAGTFTATPLIQLTKQTARAARHIPYLTDQSSTGFRAGLYDPTGNATTTENIELAIYAYQP